MGDLKVHIFDVGMGDGCLIELPSKVKDKPGGYMLVDLGSTKNKRLTLDSINEFVRDHVRPDPGNNTPRPKIVLDLLIITHADQDHLNDLKDFLDANVSVIRDYALGGCSDDYSSSIASRTKEFIGEFNKNNGFKEDARSIDVPSEFMLWTSKDNIDFDGATVHLFRDLSIDENGAHGRNGRSIITKIAYGGEVVLLTGDATRATQNSLLSKYDTERDLLKCTVLKAAHHGSLRTSGSRRWFKEVAAEFAFISADRHGSSDAEKREQSGHRLPQQAFVDLLVRHSPLNEASPHRIVTHYDPKDYYGPENTMIKGSKAASPENVHLKHSPAPDFNQFPQDDVGGGLSAANLRAAVTRPKFDNDDWEESGWINPETSKAIFTTLVEMDRDVTINNKKTFADIGTQYEIIVTRNGAVTVNTVDTGFGEEVQHTSDTDTNQIKRGEGTSPSGGTNEKQSAIKPGSQPQDTTPMDQSH